MDRTKMRRAFTLIELLVVIAIIALLLSVTMPALRKAKQHAQRVACKSNLHNYGIAGNQYLVENKEYFPDPWQNIYDSCQGRCGGQCGNDAHWAFQGEVQRYCRWHNINYDLNIHAEYAGPLWSYLQNAKVNLCPVFKALSAQRYTEHSLHVATITYEPQFGYSQNAYLGSAHYTTAATAQFRGVARLSDVRVPARTFYFGEENMWELNTTKGYRENLSTAVLNDTALLARAIPTNPNAHDDCFATFHSPPSGNYNEGMSNAVMLDGAVESVRPHDSGTFRKAWPKTGMVLN